MEFNLSRFISGSIAPQRHLVEAAILFSAVIASTVSLLLPAQTASNLSMSASAISTLSTAIVKPLPELETETTSAVVAPIAAMFFGDEVRQDTADSIVSDQMDFVSSRKAYSASLQVIMNHKDSIITQAREMGVPQDVAIGVAFLENGGSEHAKSPAGALGIYQLMPRTARNLGLTVNKSRDDRLDPEKSINAGLTYLKQNYIRFGDWGLATWAYHAGEGNVAKALQIYALEHDGVKLAGVSDAVSLRNYVEAHKITIYKLLSDAQVKTFTAKLHDDSAGYPFKVVATATLFRQANQS